MGDLYIQLVGHWVQADFGGTNSQAFPGKAVALAEVNSQKGVAMGCEQPTHDSSWGMSALAC